MANTAMNTACNLLFVLFMAIAGLTGHAAGLLTGFSAVSRANKFLYFTC